MKSFFTKNKKLVEIFLTLLLVLTTGGYYYLIYIPSREDQIVERRFRTLQRVETNMQDKFQGYLKTVNNCLSKADAPFFNDIVKIYNKNPEKFLMSVVKTDTMVRKKENAKYFDSIYARLFDEKLISNKVKPTNNGKKLIITSDRYSMIGKSKNLMKHLTLESSLDYREFVVPLLRKNVFDHYLVFNVTENVSNIIYEDFPSGISFTNLDSLYKTKQKIYSSRITNIETGGEKYLAFIHPCGYNNKNDRIVVGLMKQSKFDEEKRELPDSIVTAILFIAMFAFLLLPIIRLKLMGKRERIRFFDVYGVYFCFLLIVPVAILLFFWNINNFKFISKQGKDSKSELANQISSSLTKEIISDFKVLDGIDKKRYFETDLRILDSVNVRYMADKKRSSSHVYAFSKKDIDKTKKYDVAAHKLAELLNGDTKTFLNKNAEYVFWLANGQEKDKGKELASWSFGKDQPRGNYADRNYFKDVTENNLIFLDSTSEGFSLEPLVSRIDGRFKVAISKKSVCDSVVAVVSCRFISILNPVLPLGYNFTITDDAGKTIFDSDSTHNLNANLLEEFTNTSPFVTALTTKTITKFETRYEDEDYSVLTQPIGKLPYFITIMEQQSYDSSLNTQCISFTMMMMFVLFLFLCLEIILVLITHFRQTKLRKNAFDLSWIYPRISMSDKYYFLSFYNLSLIITVSLFCLIQFSFARLNEYIFLFIMATLASSIAACSFGTNIISPKSWKEKMKTRNRNTYIALSIVSCFVLLYSHRHACLHSTVPFTTIAIVLFYFMNKYVSKTNIHRSQDFMKHFRYMVFSKILLISGLPVIFFFACIYNFEQKLQERSKLYDYAQNIDAHVKLKGQLNAVLNQIKSQGKVKSFYTDSNWIESVDTISVNRIDTNTIRAYNENETACLDILKSARLRYNSASNLTENFELIKPDGTDNNQFIFNSIFNDNVSTLYYRINEINRSVNHSTYLVLKSSSSKKYHLPIIFSSPDGVLFWFLFLVIIVLLYQLLKYAINRIFGRHVHGIDDYKLMHDRLLENSDIKYLFVQGIPGTHKSSFIKTHLEANNNFKFFNAEHPASEYTAVNINLEEIPDVEEMAIIRQEYDTYIGKDNDKLKDNWLYKTSLLNNPKVECIVFSHFEYKIVDDHTNKVKLNLIEKLVLAGKKKIVISSDMDPLEYFNSLKKFMGDANEPNAKKGGASNLQDAAQSNSAFYEYMNRWNNLLGRFTNIFNDTNFSLSATLNATSFAEEFIAKECSYPVFMNKYQDQFKGLVDSPDKVEDYILKLQSLSDHSYRQIWASLTKEEQLTLFDLAEDGLVNTSNYQAITMLINKGLVLKKDGMLIIMNSSFRNFMLTTINSKEVESIEKEINEGQTWNDYKYPVLILLGALIYFVLSSNPEKFGNVLPVISGIMAGIPAVLKLITYFKPADARA